MQEQSKLVRFPAMACGLVGAGVKLHVLDEVFHATARAVDLLVKMLAPAVKIGDDKADVRAKHRGLDPCDDFFFASP